MSRHLRKSRAIMACAVACLLVADATAAAPAAPPPLRQAPASALQGGPQSEIEDQFAVAEAVFFSADQPEAIALFDALILRLGGLVIDRTDVEPLLLRSLSYRAQAHHNLGDEETARADLQRMLSADPAADVDRDLVSPKFTELFDAVRAETIGYLSVLVAPADATLLLDEGLVDWSAGAVALEAGVHTISIERLGFKAHQAEIEVEAGAPTPIETILERNSAVASFTVAPADVEIELDGQIVVPIMGRPGSQSSSDTRSRSLGGLALGAHRIEIRRDGYRTRAHTFQVDALADYDLGALGLERAVGTIVLGNFPEDAALEVDGVAATVQRSAEGDTRLELSPGSHSVEVNAGRRGVFAATVDVVDREEHLVEVEPRPSVAFLGVLGDDDLGRDTVVVAAESALAGHRLWTWQDRAERAAAVLASEGLDRATLRAGSAPGRERIAAAREGITEAVQASAYVLAVLDDDLLATSVDLWIWPGPPGPAAVQVMSFSLEGGGLDEALGNAFSVDLAKRRAYLGAQLIDSGASPYPTVIAVAPDGPAATAGLGIGDEIVAFDGVTLGAVAELHRAVASAGAREVDLKVKRGTAEITVRASLGESVEAMLPGVADVPYGLMWAAAEAHTFLAEDPAPDWVLGLDQAAVLLHTSQWEGAVRLLRTVHAPERAGLGQGMVDYWLGLALLRLGPNYRDHARSAFERAAAIEGATLGHDDGPLIGPLAQALLTALGS